MKWFINKEDHKPVDVLVKAALTETDEEARHKLVRALQMRGTREVLTWAERLCRSQCPKERRLAADILGQLGVPDRTFPRESCERLFGLLREGEDPDILHAAQIGLSSHPSSVVVPIALRYAQHHDSRVRLGVAVALGGEKSSLAIDALTSLTRDPDSEVRNWATFGLGTLLELDTPDIRESLADRLSDPDYDTRCEALVALAQRGDQRVVEFLKSELNSNDVGILVVEAAKLIACSELHPYLVKLRDWWDLEPELLEEAIAACEPR